MNVCMIWFQYEIVYIFLSNRYFHHLLCYESTHILFKAMLGKPVTDTETKNVVALSSLHTLKTVALQFTEIEKWSYCLPYNHDGIRGCRNVIEDTNDSIAGDRCCIYLHLSTRIGIPIINIRQS